MFAESLQVLLANKKAKTRIREKYAILGFSSGAWI